MTFQRHIKSLQGRFWRSIFLGQEENLLAPAKAPHGRWHYGGQKALYLSGSPEGCRVAVKAYQRSEDPPRGIFPIDVEADRIVDLRLPEIRNALGISLDDLHVFWATLHSEGIHPSTWRISDALRDEGADGVLTPSRSRPDLTHLTLFRWNGVSEPRVARGGSPQTF
ncbi:RES family NAD+ phosphorylase [Aliiroseovarius sp. KMU-50]|uniref:RES family NAD+ phosphorylase n=1 Tax=Aliiroseovarius salicola TaxID=3009082 RepID=A0ABT4W1L6_9RHOB|nr:RES family NAD+ phosphorylase [Aliiroseovarius sp. KMU-50]MDA5093648.1 RES family NAD+ phosphorylase [Aliiroseovarius sp. KMU-50]